MGEKVKVSMDMDELTFEELEDFEDATGLVMSEAIKTVIVRDPKTNRAIADPDDPKGRPLKEVRMKSIAMRGLVWIALKRDNPEISFEEVKKMRPADIDFDVVEGSDGTAGNSSEPV